jgi:hypothetical protein
MTTSSVINTNKATELGIIGGGGGSEQQPAGP